jgi:hypothetical protein
MDARRERSALVHELPGPGLLCLRGTGAHAARARSPPPPDAPATRHTAARAGPVRAHPGHGPSPATRPGTAYGHSGGCNIASHLVLVRSAACVIAVRFTVASDR